MVEMVEILDGRLGKRSVERVRYVINNLLHLVIVKYGDISLVLCISTRLRLVTILSQLVKYLVIYYYTLTHVIGERSKPLSDKLGGEICIATRALVCIYLYM